MLYNLFDLYIEINPIYEAAKQKLSPFLSKDKKTPDFIITHTAEEIEKESSKDPEHSKEYHEMICILRHITNHILDFNGMFIHSAVVEYDGNGYMFLGMSGAGKSTHAEQWVKHFDGKAKIINGDKPVIRFLPDGIYAYGSPWCGEQGWYENARVRLFSACFINQSTDNKIMPLSAQNAFSLLLNQIVLPNETDKKLKHYELLDRLLKQIPFYDLYCDISPNAVEIAYNTMKLSKEEI